MSVKENKSKNDVVIVKAQKAISGRSRISERRGANPQGGGANLLFGQKIPEKLHENERIWTQRGRVPAPPP